MMITKRAMMNKADEIRNSGKKVSLIITGAREIRINGNAYHTAEAAMAKLNRI